MQHAYKIQELLEILLFFYVAYVVTDFIYVKLPRVLEFNYELIFVTLPFSLLENLSPI
jgi:hypothetical protein